MDGSSEDAPPPTPGTAGTEALSTATTARRRRPPGWRKNKKNTSAAPTRRSSRGQSASGLNTAGSSGGVESITDGAANPPRGVGSQNGESCFERRGSWYNNDAPQRRRRIRVEWIYPDGSTDSQFAFEEGALVNGHLNGPGERTFDNRHKEEGE